MTVACPAKVPGFDTVSGNVAYDRRSHQERIIVEEYARLIVVVMNAELTRVTFPLRVLPENVRNENRLITEIPEIDAVQFAVCVLLKQIEVSGVEVIAVVSKLAEQ